MDDDKFKEQLDSMIRQAVLDALDKLGISVNFKEMPDENELERLLKKHQLKVLKENNPE